MKNLLSFALVLMTVMSLLGCSETSGVDDGSGAISHDVSKRTTSLVTEKSFADMGLPIQMPSDGSNPFYAILEGEIAELRFSMDDCSYTLRASKTVEGDKHHGMDVPLEGEFVGIHADGDDFCYSMSIFTMEQGGQIASNTIQFLEHDTIYLSLVSENSTSDVETLLSAISNDVIEHVSSVE